MQYRATAQHQPLCGEMNRWYAVIERRATGFKSAQRNKSPKMPHLASLTARNPTVRTHPPPRKARRFKVSRY